MYKRQVVAKGKGSGFLGLPEELERFLDTVFDAAPCAVGQGLDEGVDEGGAAARHRRKGCLLYTSLPLQRNAALPNAAQEYHRPL